MILQALTNYYQVLNRRGKIAAPGWSPVKVSFALCIGEDGTLERVIGIQTQQARGNKTVLAPPGHFPPGAGEAYRRSSRQLPLGQFRLHPGHRRQGQAPEEPGVLRSLQGPP